MTFNKIKYICIFVAVIIITSICLPLTFLKDSSAAVIEGQNYTPETNTTPVGENRINRVFNNAYDCFNFANNLIVNGKGYDMQCNSLFKAKVSDVVYNQYMGTKYQKNTKARLETTVFACDVQIANNNMKVIHCQQGDLAHTYGSEKLIKKDPQNFNNNQFDFTGRPLEVNSYPSEFEAHFHRNLEIFPFDVNKNTTNTVYFRSDVNNYYFEINLYERAIDPFYFEFFTNLLGSTDFDFKYLKFVGIVSKETGAFKYITVDAAYSIFTSRFVVPARVEGTLTQKYTIYKMDKEADFEVF